MQRVIPRGIIPAALGFLLGVLLVWHLAPREVTVDRYRTVEVPVEVLVQGEPDTVTQWRDRIVTRTVQAEVQATAPETALPDINAFCGAAGWRAPGDTIHSRGNTPAPDPRLLIRSFVYRDGELQAWGPRSDGDLWSGTYRVRAPFEATVSGDSLFVQGSRWAGWRTWGERALWIGAGALAGYAAGQF